MPSSDAAVQGLHRYPVKSMLGEAVATADIGEDGIAGDRGMALVERDTGIVASAKQPRKWGWLLQCRAVLHSDGVCTVTLPDGETVRSDDADVHDVLSDFAERPVALSASPPLGPRLERLWPDVDGLAPEDVIERAGPVTRMAAAAPGTFFDYAPLHVVTTSSLRQLRSAHGGDYAAARFRPNIVLDTDDEGFVENTWPGAQLTMNDVVLEVLTVTPRCAVPSLAHGDLASDLGILRGVVHANRLVVGEGRFACVGVYCRVVRPGSVAVGDAVAV